MLVLNAWAAWPESDLRQSAIPCLSAGLAINPNCLVSRSTPQKKCSWWGKAISRLILPWFIVMRHIYAGEINILVLPPLRVKSYSFQSYSLFLLNKIFGWKQSLWFELLVIRLLSFRSMTRLLCNGWDNMFVFIQRMTADANANWALIFI